MASEFLRKKAAGRKKVIDEKFGSSEVYGGSNYDMKKRTTAAPAAAPELFTNLYDYAQGLKSQLDSTKKQSNRDNFSDYSGINDYESSQAAKSTLPDLQKQYDEAMEYYYSYLPYASDYSDLSKAGQSKASKSKLLAAYGIGGDSTYDYINNIEGFADTLGGQDAPKTKYSKYSYMNDDEKGVYNYVYAKYGKDAATSYLDSLAETLNYRYGNNIYEGVKDKPVLKYTTSAHAGIQSFFEGLQQLFTEEALPTSESQYAYQKIQEDLADDGPKILGRSLGQMGADLMYTAGNMLPSVVLSVAGGALLGAGAQTEAALATAGKIANIAGAGSLGASAGGNAYNQAVKDGYTPDQARTYGTIIGISEGALEYAIGGISSLGGVSAEKLTARFGLIRNGILRFASTLSVNMASEGVEEGLQEILQPLFSNAILGTDDTVNWGNVTYAALMGAAMGGVFEGTSMAVNGASYTGKDYTMRQSAEYMGNSGVDYFEGINDLTALKAKYRELAKQYAPDLHQDMAAEYTEIMKVINNQHDMIEAFLRSRDIVNNSSKEDTSATSGISEETITRLLGEGKIDAEEITAGDQAPASAAPAEEIEPVIEPETIEPVLSDPGASQTYTEPEPIIEQPEVKQPEPEIEQPAQAQPSALEQAAQQQATEEDNHAQLVKAASTLGDSGGKALMAAYDGTAPVADYFGDFAQIYNCGKKAKAKSLDQITPKMIDEHFSNYKNLTSAQRYAAWVAGYKDGHTSVAQETKPAENTTKVPEVKADKPQMTSMEKAAWEVLMMGPHHTWNYLGINYFITGSKNLGYIGHVERESEKDAYPISDARNNIYTSQKFATVEEAADDVVAVARNNKLLIEKKPLTNAKPESTIKADNTNNTVKGATDEKPTDKGADSEAPVLQPVSGGKLETVSPEGLSENGGNGNADSSSGTGRKPGVGTDGRPDAVGNDGKHGVGDSEGTSVSSDAVTTPDKLPDQVAAAEAEQVTEQPKGRNFIIGESLDLPSGEKARFNANIEAIKIVKQLIAENRWATPGEQVVLSRYVGWGGLSEILNEYKYNYYNERKQLKDLVTVDEYNAISKSTLNAHYTSIEVIRAMYEGIFSLGFRGGRLLEPSCGIGHFAGAMPIVLMPFVKSMTLVELDTITGNIAKYLYPNYDVRVQGFQEAILPDNYMDVAIGNVPFGNFGVKDKNYPASLKNPIHNYFFAKSLDKVRPGGLVVFITSRYTLDNKDSYIREYIKSKADLIGAIRLPDTAFKDNARTEVVTDILILKKREVNTPYAGEEFTESKPHAVGKNTFDINTYYDAHPNMLLGTASDTGKMYQGDSLTYKANGDNLGEQIKAAFKNITAKMDYPEKPSAESTTANTIKASNGTKKNGLVKKDGKVYVNVDGVLTDAGLSDVETARMGKIIDIRDTARGLLNAQLKGASEEDIAKLRKKLNKDYDSFVAQHGRFHNSDRTTKKSGRANLKLIELDADSAFIKSLENYDKKNDVCSKSDIFTKNTVAPRKTVTHADSIPEGLTVSINEKGNIDIPYIAQLTGKTEEAVTNALLDSRMIFKTMNGSYETASAYLSGNVRAKLGEARSMALLDPFYNRNVEELKKVIPPDIEPESIRVSLGAVWVPTYVYEEFAAYVLDVPQMFSLHYSVNKTPSVEVSRNAITGKYSVHIANERAKYGVENKQKWGTPERSFEHLMNSIMNASQIIVKKTDSDGRSYTDTQATLAAQEKALAIKNEFQSWIWKDAERAKKLSRLYNDTNNNIVNPKYDGSNLTINGLNSTISLRPHQLNAVQRIISSGGNTLLQHMAGAGKTAVMCGAIMKMRQLGILKKPIIVAKKSLVPQWGEEFRTSFPTAKLLVAEDGDTGIHKRKEFSNRIATGDYDAIIISYESFKALPLSNKTLRDFIQEQIDELVEAIDEAVANGQQDAPTTKELAKRKERLEVKLDTMSDMKKDTDNIDFEELGVDGIFVDEAHNYKNLFYVTSMNNVSGLGAKDGNQSTFDMYSKIRYLQKLNGGKGIVFATATPVMNSMSEMYIMQKYLQYDLLKQRGLNNFDAWAAQFGEVRKVMEIKPTGQGYRQKDSFSKFINVPELMQMYLSFADVVLDVTDKDGKPIKLPKMKTGKYIVVKSPLSPRQKEYMEELVKRAEAVKGQRSVKGGDNMLSITNDGRKMAYTQKMIDPSLPYEDDCKVMNCVKNVYEIWQETASKRSTQLVFVDLTPPKGRSKKDKLAAPGEESVEAEDAASVSMYKDIKKALVLRGVPSNEIAFIHDANTPEEKNQLFDDMNNGVVRVLIGSTKKMGEGMNAQRKIIAIHHLDAPYRPGDMEQRDRRGIRQKNENEEVAIYTYITEGSFDARLWDILKRKAGFINAVMRGESSAREAEDIGEFQLSAAEVMAHASGNPLVKEQIELEMEINRLEMLQQAHTKAVRNVEFQYHKALDTQKWHQLMAANAAKDLKKRQDTTGDKFVIDIGGKQYTDREEAGKQLNAAAAEAVKTAPEEGAVIAKFAGFDVLLNKAGDVWLSGENKYSFLLNLEAPRGSIQSLESAARNMDTRYASAKEGEATAAAEAKKLKELIESKFEQEGELIAKRKRLNEVMAILNPPEENSGVASDEEEEEDGDDEGGNTEKLISTDTSAQEINSAATSINSSKLPAVFSKVKFQPGTINLDIGGGRFDNATVFLSSQGVTNYIYDPYNRSQEHNDAVVKKTQEGQSDTVTISNVLNVIKEQKARDNVLANAVDAVKPDGTVYITIYEGNKQGVGHNSIKGWQENRVTSSYMSEVHKFFASVTIKDNVIVAKKPKKNTAEDITDKSRATYASPASQWQTTRTEGNASPSKSLADIIAKLKHSYEIPISTGHIRGKDTLGQYSRKYQSIRSRITNSLTTINHELGHHLDNIHNITDHLAANIKSELTNALSAEFKAAYKEEKWAREGMAEFIREYLQNRDKAAEKYKLFTPYFLNKLTASEAVMLNEVADEINAYYSQSSLDKMRSTIYTAESKGPDFRTATEKAHDALDYTYQKIVDSNHSLKMFDDYAGSKVYTHATNAAYVNDRAYSFLIGDMYDYDGNRVGPGLQQALEGIHLDNAKEYADFGLYLVCQNGMERLSEGLRVFADDSINTIEAMQEKSEQLEEMYPAFKDAAAKLYDFQNQLVKSWLVDTGLISKETAAEWIERWPHYVPFNRKFTDQYGAARSAGGVKRGAANQIAPIMQARGSGRAFVNPVDNIISNLVKCVTAGTYNTVANKLISAAASTEGSALFLEKVPAPLRVKTFDLTSLKEKLKEATTNSALTAADKDAMFEIIGNVNDILTQYGRGKAHGDVVAVMRGGKPEFYKVNDPLMLDTLTNMSPTKLPGILDAYGRIIRFTMAATTGYNVVWSVMSNAPRDAGAVFTYSRDRNPIHIFGAMAEAYVNKIKGSRADPMFKEYLAMGGGRTSAYSADKNLAKSIRTKLTGNKLQYLNPLEWLDFVGDLIELGPRYACYKIYRSRYGMNAHEAFYAAQDLTVNFKKKGSAASMKILNNIIPYNNASIQGLDKFGRWLTATDVSPDSRAKASKGRVAALTAASLGLAAVMLLLNGLKDEDRENYAQLSTYTKNSYWCIPIGGGKYFCIPKPREIAVLTSFFEASIERFIYGNDDAFREFYSYATDNMLPNVAGDVASGDWNGLLGNFGIASTLYGIEANKDFLGKPIVSAGLENLEPEDQYNRRTSKLAYWIGQAFNVSPQKVDYFGGQTLGGAWKWQKALWPVGSENADLTLGIQSSYVKDNQYSTDVTNKMYDTYAKAVQKHKSHKEDMAAAVAYKDASNMTSFYSDYYSLAKDLPETEYNRAVRQTVLEIIIEYNKSVDSGTSTRAHDAVAAICESQGDTELMPSAVNTYITAESGEKVTLTASEYVEYQTNYNRLYWDYVEDALNYSSGKSMEYQAALVKAAKARALTEAQGAILEAKGDSIKDYAIAQSLESKGIDSTEFILYKAAIDMVDNDGLNQKEVIEAINGISTLTNREKYYLFQSKYPSDKNNPWKDYK